MSNLSKDNWTKEQDQILNQLTAKIKIKDWNVISSSLRKLSPNSTKSSKDCSYRFLKLLQVKKRPKKDNQWSREEMIQLKDVFTKYGLKWTFLTRYFLDRSENSIKNRFYNSLRKTARKLMEYQNKMLKSSGKSSLTCEMLTIILELSFQLENQAEFQNFIIPKECILFDVRTKLLTLAFDEEAIFDDQQIYQIVKCVRKLNSSLRCFGVYKTKKRKNWNLNSKRLLSVLKILVPGSQFPDDKTEQKNKQQKDDTFQNKEVICEQIKNKSQPHIQNNEQMLRRYRQEEMLYWYNYQYMMESRRQAQIYLTQYNHFINSLAHQKNQTIENQQFHLNSNQNLEEKGSIVKIQEREVGQLCPAVKIQQINLTGHQGFRPVDHNQMGRQNGMEIKQQNNSDYPRKEVFQFFAPKVEYFE